MVTPISAATMPARVVLPSPGGPGEEQVVGRLPSAPGRLEDDAQVLLQLGLPHEVGERAGPQSRFGEQLALGGLGVEELLSHRRPPAS